MGQFKETFIGFILDESYYIFVHVLNRTVSST